MLKTTNIRNTKRTIWICVILFALSPCIVKKAVFGSVYANYTKPLNKSKTTTQINFCDNSQNQNLQNSTVKQTKISKQTEPVKCLVKQLFVVRSAKVFGQYSKTFSGNSPPKYILYKRMKLHIA